jgi:hypothetical protein
MAMNRGMWSPEERAEHDAMRRRCLEEATTPDALDLYEGLINDAIQAHRFWAMQLYRSNHRHGAASDLKRFQDQARRLKRRSPDGRVVSLPAYQGTKVRSAKGDGVHVRGPIERWSRVQITEKREDEIQACRRHTDRTALCDDLLHLLDLCPEAKTPDEAARRLGTTVEAFLRSREESA